MGRSNASNGSRSLPIPRNANPVALVLIGVSALVIFLYLQVMSNIAEHHDEMEEVGVDVVPHLKHDNRERERGNAVHGSNSGVHREVRTVHGSFS